MDNTTECLYHIYVHTANNNYKVMNLPLGVKAMAKNNKGFYWKISSANVLSDGMLKEVSYGDYALMSALKDKPPESRYSHKNLNEFR